MALPPLSNELAIGWKGRRDAGQNVDHQTAFFNSVGLYWHDKLYTEYCQSVKGNEWLSSLSPRQIPATQEGASHQVRAFILCPFAAAVQSWASGKLL